MTTSVGFAKRESSITERLTQRPKHTCKQHKFRFAEICFMHLSRIDPSLEDAFYAIYPCVNCNAFMVSEIGRDSEEKVA
jgi:hypothetical protein